jgi:cytochrome c-type biogenesis protein CcsB
MNQEILDRSVLAAETDSEENESVSTWHSYIPFAAAVFGSIVLLLLRVQTGGERFISDGALMMLALAAYCTAAVFYLTNLYAPSDFAEKIGMWTATLGVFFNLSSWLVRWVAAYDREIAVLNAQGYGAEEMPWIFRYIPFANLYDLSLAFAFGAGVTTLLVIRREQFKSIATLALPLAAIILVLARFIGGDFVDLPPVLDSYWRPIHVGIASISYGVALVCFAVAVLYLLKDGLKIEAMAIWTSVFALSVFATISKFSVFSLSTFGTYTASTFVGTSRQSLALRADIPYAGWFMIGAAAMLAGTIAAYAIYLSNRDGKAKTIGRLLLHIALILQGAGIAVLVYQIKSIQNVLAYINPAQYERFAVWMLQQQEVPQAEINQISSPQLYQIADQWIQQNAAQLYLSLNANPVELAALITAFTGTFFVILFGYKTEKIRAALPTAETLDGLMYKLAGVAFAGLALLLITGAVWANESWGRYWGWDAKEVGALVAWLTYAAFLHTRIARGWKGRSSAYFAVAAFLFVIFTYLGVSYLLPGLHSYA